MHSQQQMYFSCCCPVTAQSWLSSSQAAVADLFLWMMDTCYGTDEPTFPAAFSPVSVPCTLAHCPHPHCPPSLHCPTWLLQRLPWPTWPLRRAAHHLRWTMVIGWGPTLPGLRPHMTSQWLDGPGSTLGELSHLHFWNRVSKLFTFIQQSLHLHKVIEDWCLSLWFSFLQFYRVYQSAFIKLLRFLSLGRYKINVMIF